MEKRTFIETFDHGPCGWIGWGTPGPLPVEIKDGMAITRGPWWIDCNHAPPGGGYLHLLFALFLRYGSDIPKVLRDIAGPNPFIEGNYPTNLTNARITVKVKGSVQLKGAEMALLVQGNTSHDPARLNFVNQILVGQPIRVTEDWTEQTITLTPDQSQWAQLGGRHNRTDRYKEADIADLLKNVNYDIIFVLFPLNVRPAVPFEGNMHEHWWVAPGDGTANLADQSCLPQGTIMLDEVKIEFS